MTTLTILIIVLFLLLIGMGYYVYLLNSKIAKIKKDISNIPDYSQKVDSLDKEIESLRSGIANYLAPFYRTITEMEAKVNGLIVSSNEQSMDSETFIFFSDPHPFTSYDTIEWSKDTQLERIKDSMEVSGSKFVLCGGDWLTNHNEQTGIDDLKMAESVMNQTFGDKYYPMVGNHDNNDKAEEIPHDTLVDIFFKRWGRAYYSFMGDATKFYVFDSDSIPHIAMDDYKREQTKWFIDNLMVNDDKHIIIAIHMAQIMDDGGPISSEQVTILSKIADIYNGRWQYEGYDFSNKTGKVHVILAGHWHEDNDYMLNNIPVYIIDDAQEGNFDIVHIDYETNELKAVRVGTGRGRTIKLA